MEVVSDRTVGEQSVAEGIAPLSLNGVFRAVAGSSQSFRVQVIESFVTCLAASRDEHRTVERHGCQSQKMKQVQVHGNSSQREWYM